jgi:hypothetical protein
MPSQPRPQVQSSELLPHRVIPTGEMAAWPVDRKRSYKETWSETAWGGDNEERPKLFNWNIWPNRIVFHVDVPPGTPVVRGEAVWRRSSLSIRVQGLKLLHAESGTLVQDARLIHYNQDSVIIDFRPAAGNGVYHLYFGAAERVLFDASPEWLDLSTSIYDPPRAIPECIEARCQLDSFYPMEVIALNHEVETLLGAHPEAPYLVFPEDRDRPIKLRAEIPAHWAREGPSETVELQADRNEYRVFQLGIWACRADQNDIQVSVSDLQSEAGTLPASSLQCVTLESKTRHLYMGRPTGPFDVPQGQVGALWFGLDLPRDCVPGTYQGTLLVQPAKQPPTAIPIRVYVSAREVPEHGDHDLWRLSRLRWLESDVGLTSEVIAPFTALTHSEHPRTVSTWGHTYILATTGLVEQLQVGTQEILALPIALTGEREGRPITWQESRAEMTTRADDHVTWRGQSQANGLRLAVEGRLEFDGCAILTLDLDADEACRIDALALTLAWRPEHAELASGMGYRGRRTGNRTWRQSEHPFHFGPCLWLGSIQAGLGWVTESGEPWADPGRVDAATIVDHGEAIVLRMNFGAHTVGPDGSWHLRFALRPTPVKPPDPRHWQFRTMHVGGDFRPGENDTPQSFLKDDCRRLDEAREIGVRRLNLHDWWGPAFNYPWQWDGPDNLSRLTAEAHARGLYVKVYNSGRELSTLAPEFWALVEEASRGEVSVVSDPHLAHQRFQDAWHENHLPDDFAQGWPRLPLDEGNEHSVVVGCAHRYGNFYLESIRYMTRFFGTDGAYWDGAEFPYPSQNRRAGFGYVDRDGSVRPTKTYLAVRELAKRMWAMLRQENPNATIDSHHGNTLLESPITEHMLCLPFIDSIWHGEGYDYERMDPWTWLVEIAGLPFGVPSELLGGDAFIGRAMLFGIWPRAGWSAGTEIQRRLWAFFDRFAIEEATMLGWWELNHPVVVDRPETYATAFVHPDNGALIALSSWHPPIAEWIGHPLDVSLLLDRRKLGLGAGKLEATDLLTDEILDLERPLALPRPQEGRLIWVRRQHDDLMQGTIHSTA